MAESANCTESPCVSSAVVFDGEKTSSVTAQASNALVAKPTTPGTLSFSSNSTLAGYASALLGADTGQTTTVGGNLILTSTNGGSGGAASVIVNDGTLAITGQTFIDTSALGSNNPPGIGGNATGGQSRLTINGGTVTLGDTLFLLANATGGGGILATGNGTAGTAALTLNAGATPTLLTMTGIANQISAQIAAVTWTANRTPADTRRRSSASPIAATGVRSGSMCRAAGRIIPPAPRISQTAMNLMKGKG